jgi:AraC-like DNA-binding protein
MIYLLAPIQLAKLGFAIGAMIIVWRGREHDVVESRLKLRSVFAAGIGVIVAAVVATELVTGWKVPALIEMLGMAAIFIATLTLNLAFLRLNPSFDLRGSRAVAPELPEDTSVVDALNRVMSEDLAYTNHDLRIADLAAQLKVPEYQLRRTINRNLGHRNFNQFVNGYRVEAAARRLVDEPRIPVLTIALDVGFRSISSFNTAFRAQYGKTPTEYRKSKLPDS